MPKSLNRAQLIGNLGRDVETKYTASGTAVANVSIATTSSFKNKQDQWEDRTDWHNLTLWGRLAEIAAEYLHKGSKVYVEGRMETQSWEDRDTKKKMYKTVVVVAELIMLDGKNTDQGSDEERTRRQGRGEERTGREGTAVGPGNEVDDSDIPF